ncbi:hypothetical protein GOODEAATRI_023478 [Goodea atripinnis]|uniref:Uncharacterized protein n=1 Tax=Goodea atripinnis TaxID=208336 RepID=A0ABV0PR28_9TELE
MEMQISFSNMTWHLHTVSKLPVPGLRSMVSWDPVLNWPACAPFPLARFGQPRTSPHGSARCVLHFHRPAFAPLRGTPPGGAALKHHVSCCRTMNETPNRQCKEEKTEMRYKNKK